MRRLIIPLLVILVTPMFGAFERLPYSGRSAALGFSSVSLAACPWGIWHNPAGLSATATQAVSVSFVPGVFGMTELSHAAGVYSHPFPFGTLGVGASRFGFELYRETRLALSASTAISDDLHLGVTINYFGLGIQNYGTAATFGVDAGLLVRISDDVWWGSLLGNINAAAIGASKEKLPQILSTGVAFSPVSEALLVAAVTKDIRHPVQISAGLEYTFLDVFAARVGTSTEPSIMTAGVGVTVAFGRFDYGFSSHSLLGSTHTISLTIHFNESEVGR